MIRRHIQASVVASLRPAVERVVRKTVADPKHRREAVQVGSLGVLVALEKHDPTGRVPFRRLALTEARREISRWKEACREGVIGLSS
jgi:hypothetical protein